MSYKIILTKIKKNPVIILVHKHKLKEIIGVIKDNKITIDFIKMHKYVKIGCSFSKTAFDIIYKEISKTQEIF